MSEVNKVQGRSRRRQYGRQTVSRTQFFQEAREENREEILRSFSNYPIFNFLIGLTPEAFFALEVSVGIMLQADLNMKEKELLALFLVDVGFNILQLGRQKHRQNLVLENFDRLEAREAIEEIEARLEALEAQSLSSYR